MTSGYLRIYRLKVCVKENRHLDNCITPVRHMHQQVLDSLDVSKRDFGRVFRQGVRNQHVFRV